MVVDEAPDRSASLGLQHRMLVVLGHECHQALKEVVVLQEVGLRLAVLARGISDEQQDVVDELVRGRHQMAQLLLLDGWDRSAVEDESGEVEGVLDLQDLSRTLLSGSES